MAQAEQDIGRHALIAGGGGVIGRTLVNYFTNRPGWRVTALSRRPLTYRTTAHWIGVDLLDPDDCREKLSGLSDVTHLYYAAYKDLPNLIDLVAPNRAMLANFVEAIEPVAHDLDRVVLYTGGKAYGSMLGPYKTPAKETDARHMPPDFYYEQEDFLAARQRGKSWAWTVLRPSHICGLATGNPMNAAMAIAVYATISKYFGLPMRFPGRESTYERLTQFADAEQLARATLWASGADAARNQLFNCHNGDYVRWKDLWPAFAKFFDMDYAPPQRIPLSDYMPPKRDVWNDIAARHGLLPVPYEDLAGWQYADRLFNHFEWDHMSSMTKIRQHGFHDVVDSEEMFLRLFGQFREARIIP